MKQGVASWLILLYLSISFGYGLLSGAHVIVHELSLTLHTHGHAHSHEAANPHTIHDHVSDAKKLTTTKEDTTDFSHLAIVLPVFIHPKKINDTLQPTFRSKGISFSITHYLSLKTSPPNPPPSSI